MEAARRDAAEAKTSVGVLQAPIPGVFGARRGWASGETGHGEAGGVGLFTV